MALASLIGSVFVVVETHKSTLIGFFGKYCVYILLR